MTFSRAEKWTLFRFSLYGFLKNQTYFAPFLVLAFLEKGFSFFQIGLIVGFRDLCINLFEIPTGAIADLYGRRISMILSFVSYIISFVIFAISTTYWHFFVAMLFFASGEAFRTGTHKAMIFDWLRHIGRERDRTMVYGFTRSWSKVGDAVSVLIAAALVFWRGRYSDIFWLCTIPYLINIINFLGYPPETEGTNRGKARQLHVYGYVWAALRQAWERKGQRRLLLESVGFEGVFTTVKDYLQPTLKAAALALPLLVGFEDKQRVAVLVALVYFPLDLLSGVASRQAHRAEAWCGGEERAARTIWFVAFVLYAALVPALRFDGYAVAITAFVLIYMAQNLWRPALLSRLDRHSDPEMAATTLSVESQLKSFFSMAVAPLLGLAVDHWGLWTAGALGAVVAGIAVVAGLGRVPPGTAALPSGNPSLSQTSPSHSKGESE